MFPKRDPLTELVDSRDPRQGSLLDELSPLPERPPVRQATKYVFALVQQESLDILLPVFLTRRDASEARIWHVDADSLKVERCRITMCRR